MRTTISVPLPGSDLSAHTPPTNRARSFMSTSPMPAVLACGARGSKPRPSSWTVTVSRERRRVIDSVTRLARACFSILLSASWTIR